jgi:hypothetical protein
MDAGFDFQSKGWMMRALIFSLVAVSFVGIGMLCRTAGADEESIAIDKLPKAVVDAIKKQFPKAEIVEAFEEETEDDDDAEYEVALKENGKALDVLLEADGTIKSFEKELTATDLPKAVVETLEKHYPKSIHHKIEAFYEMEDEEADLEFYEIQLVTADGKTEEVKIEEDGTIVSDEGEGDEEEELWTHEFTAEKENLTSTGSNPYFILEPGYQLVFEDDDEKLVITVLNETKRIDGVETRVVEEKETQNGKIVEVSRNYFAISKRTNSVYYFGEDVDEYKGGKISGHDGSWLSGVNNAKFGLAMPGLALLNAKYQQEVAPGVAMDRAEIVNVSEEVSVPAGKFANCIEIEESSPLEPGSEATKAYAAGVGLLYDGSLKLVRYGKVELKK